MSWSFDAKQLAKAGLAAVVLAAVAAASTVTSLALFTDTENVTANSFGTGTLDLLAAPATAAITMPSMAPGDQVTQPLTVTNGGSLDLRYAMTSTTTEDPLAGTLVMTVKSGVTTCTDAGFGIDGTQLYQGIVGATATSAIFGDPTQGAQAGDRVLVGGASETLCFNVALPLTATSATEGLTTTATFTFDAEQTRNNP